MTSDHTPAASLTVEGAPEALAERFHDTYERLAPEHGYETRQESAVPWSDVPEPNRRLMIATVREVMGEITAAAQLASLRAALAAAEERVERAESALREIRDEALDGIRVGDRDGEETTYCYGNLVHIRRWAAAALSPTPTEGGESDGD